MSAKFPIYTRSRKKGEAGVDAVSSAVHDELDWIFRKNNQEHDFGIDGFIDIVEENGQVTGKTIGVQIKSGKSFFKSKTQYGFTFYGEEKHFNYYTNMHIPVILILCDIAKKLLLWVHFDPQQTSRTSSGWKIEVLKSSILCVKSKPALAELAGPIIDHLQSAQYYWDHNDTLRQMDYIHYAIDNADIRRQNFANIESFSQRLSRNNEIARRFQGRVQISVSGYENDHRELWEIEEVVRWLKVASGFFKYWFFFQDTKLNTQGLKLYFSCMCDAERSQKLSIEGRIINVEVEGKKVAKFFEENFAHLNEFTDRLGMSIEENKRISFNVMDVLGIEHL